MLVPLLIRCWILIMPVVLPMCARRMRSLLMCVITICRFEWILETHVHADHLSAAPYLHQALGGKTGIGAFINSGAGYVW